MIEFQHGKPEIAEANAAKLSGPISRDAIGKDGMLAQFGIRLMGSLRKDLE